MNFEIVKAYREDIYSSWTIKTPEVELYLSEEAYFIKVDGKYFFLGDKDNEFYMEEQ